MPRRQAHTLLLSAALPLLAACSGTRSAAPQTAATSPGVLGQGVVEGRVTFEGAVPPAKLIKTTDDCIGAPKDGLPRQPIRVEDGGLADVVVYVKSGVRGAYPAPSAAVTLDQKGCDYVPHVVALQVGQPLRLVNSDPTLHNVHPRPAVNEEWNVSSIQGRDVTRTFDQPEIMIPMNCNVHPWMRSYVSVVAHPFFAVTGPDGRFSIHGLPAGDYEIEAVHETLRSQAQKVTVKDGAPAALQFTFKGPSA